MHYHHRYTEDGNCEIVCTHCFLTIGAARGLPAIKRLEAAHICTALAHKNDNSAPPLPNGIPSREHHRLRRYSEKIAGLPVPLLFVVVALVLYALPTAMEIGLTPEVGTWLAGIVLGDLAACAFISVVFKMRRTGVVLYLLLTMLETSLYLAHIIPARAMPWMSDAIPALFVLIRVFYTRSQTVQRASCC